MLSKFKNFIMQDFSFLRCVYYTHNWFNKENKISYRLKVHFLQLAKM